MRSRRGRTSALLLFVFIAQACREGPPGASRALLELAGDTIELPSGVTLHEIRLRQREAGREIEPAQVSARVGDVLRFVATDARGYSVRFQRDGLQPAAAEFLERTHQLASPPLLSMGAAWVVSLDGAPPGEYPFLSANQGAGGVIVVQP